MKYIFQLISYRAFTLSILMTVFYTNIGLCQNQDDYMEQVDTLTKPRLITISRIDPLTNRIKYLNQFSHFFNKNGQKDSTIIINPNYNRIKLIYLYNGEILASKSQYNYNSKGIIDHKTINYFDQYAYNYKYESVYKIGTSEESKIFGETYRDSSGLKLYSITKRIHSQKKDSTISIKVYSRSSDSKKCSVIKYSSDLPLRSSPIPALTYNTLEFYTSKQVHDIYEEISNDTLITTIYKKGNIYKINKYYKRPDYKYEQESAFKKKSYLTQTTITSMDTVQFTLVQYLMQDSKFVKHKEGFRQITKSDFTNFEYNFINGSRSNDYSGIFSYEYDIKGNWIKRNKISNKGTNKTVVREIKYYDN